MYQDHEMLSDTIRNSCFQKAVKEKVKPGQTVLDAGCGTGVLSVMAAQAGAGKVYAVENRPIIGVARELAKENGCENRIELIEGDVREISLPEKADGVICEMIGYAGIAEGIRSIMVRIKRDLLKPGGWMIPEWLKVYVAPVSNEGLYSRLMLENVFDGISTEAIKDEAVNNYWIETINPEAMVGEPACVMDVTLGDSISGDSGSEKSVFFASEKKKIHGFCAWFRAGLSDTVELDTAPGGEMTHWKQTFFPIREPLTVCEGDEIKIDFRSIPAKTGEVFYWKMALDSEDGRKETRAHSNALSGKIFEAHLK